MKRILICSNSTFFKKKLKKKNFFFITKSKQLNYNYLKKIKPDIIFFPHWNYIVKKKIFNKFLCIGFHSSPLPFGRGGSPVHNMIIQNFKKTTLCAIKLIDKLDAGPIYLRKSISLIGTGEEIFKNIYEEIVIMIQKIEKKIPREQIQKGKATYFKRRMNTEGNLLDVESLQKVYNLIRMLDINFLKKYPKAFIENKKILFNFSKAKFKKNKVEAKVEILRK